jgi:hypothetical protein
MVCLEGVCVRAWSRETHGMFEGMDRTVRLTSSTRDTSHTTSVWRLYASSPTATCNTIHCGFQ